MFIPREELGRRFENEERRGAEGTELQLAIQDAGGWDSYVALRDAAEED